MCCLISQEFAAAYLIRGAQVALASCPWMATSGEWCGEFSWRPQILWRKAGINHPKQKYRSLGTNLINEFLKQQIQETLAGAARPHVSGCFGPLFQALRVRTEESSSSTFSDRPDVPKLFTQKLWQGPGEILPHFVYCRFIYIIIECIIYHI